MPEFSEHQPQPGDTVGACAHVIQTQLTTGDWGAAHWFQSTDATLGCIGPDGQTKKVQMDWMVLCPACFVKYRNDWSKAPLAGFTTWESTEPIVQVSGEN